jgi:putative NIF3 family GTP cyclohydrolase 1 type 2
MELNRRTFIANTAKAALILSTPLSVFAKAPITVGEVMDLCMKGVSVAPDTVDTLKAGNRDIVVTGIVTSMFATIEIIKKAIALNANFIIAHEPTFYNHKDNTEWLEKDDVYRYKADLLKQHNIAVWRNHDVIHRMQPDGIRKGLVEQLGWQQYEESNHVIYNLSLSLKELISHLKEKLNIPSVRYIGNLDQSCKRVLMLPGAYGGTLQIQGIGEHKPDVLVCGEISEWETAEYVRDTRATGRKLSLVVLGHIASEEPGSEFLAKWLKDKLPAIKTTHIPAGNSLSFM